MWDTQQTTTEGQPRMVANKQATFGLKKAQPEQTAEVAIKTQARMRVEGSAVVLQEKIPFYRKPDFLARLDAL